MPKANLTPEEVTDICSAGQAAWEQLGPKGTEARFSWRGKTYIAKHTSFRLTIDTEDGQPVACRYD